MHRFISLSTHYFNFLSESLHPRDRNWSITAIFNLRRQKLINYWYFHSPDQQHDVSSLDHSLQRKLSTRANLPPVWAVQLQVLQLISCKWYVLVLNCFEKDSSGFGDTSCLSLISAQWWWTTHKRFAVIADWAELVGALYNFLGCPSAWNIDAWHTL